MREIDLSVLIVSWNVESLVVACLASVFKAARDLTVEVIVVDNNSADNTVAQVREKFPQVNVIANSHNAGFSCATNQALRISKGRHILLLNPDTEVTEDSLTRMISFVESNENIGLLGPMLRTPAGEIQEYCARSFPTPLNLFWYYSFVVSILNFNIQFYLNIDSTHFIKLQNLQSKNFFFVKSVHLSDHEIRFLMFSCHDQNNVMKCCI